MLTLALADDQSLILIDFPAPQKGFWGGGGISLPSTSTARFFPGLWFILAASSAWELLGIWQDLWEISAFS